MPRQANLRALPKMLAALKAADVQLDRKVLSEIAATDRPTFSKIVEQINK